MFIRKRTQVVYWMVHTNGTRHKSSPRAKKTSINRGYFWAR